MTSPLPVGYASWSDVPDPLLPTQMLSGGQSRSRKLAFVKGPLPVDWLSSIAATGLPSAIWVALALKVQADRRREPWVSPPYGILDEFGVTRSSLSRAIRALEEAGILAVQRRKGRPPLVRLSAWTGNADG
jgi:DNA-binding transcriptional ArsR family regulator